MQGIIKYLGPPMFNLSLRSILNLSRIHRLGPEECPPCCCDPRRGQDRRAADRYFWRGRHWQPPETGPF